MRETFAKWYRKVWTKLFDPIWDGAGSEWVDDGGVKAEVKKAEKQMLPFDDVDEWLAARLAQYDHAIQTIEVVTGAREALQKFVSRSQHNHYYRQIDLPTSFTVQDVKLLNTRLTLVPA